jgi:hypothetical protein
MIKKWLTKFLQDLLFTECVIYEYGKTERVSSYMLLYPPQIGYMLSYEKGTYNTAFGVVQSVDMTLFKNYKYYSIIVKPL